MAASWPEVDSGAGQAPAHKAAGHSLSLTDPRGDVRPLEDIERDAIRFAISHYRGQMSEVARRLNALAGVVPELLSISAGANSLYPDANWDVTLVSDFADAAALEAYQVHPAHEEAAGYIRSVVSGRVAVDFEI